MARLNLALAALGISAVGLAACTSAPAARAPATTSFPSTPAPVALQRPVPLSTAWAAEVASVSLAYPAGRDCGIVNSGQWSGEIRQVGRATRELIVRGTVGVKPSTKISLTFGDVLLQSRPVQRRARLTGIDPPYPTADMLSPKEVTSRLVYNGDLGEAAIVCGRRVIATIRDPREQP